jgi:uncharacterized protein (DUF1501 family)
MELGLVGCGYYTYVSPTGPGLVGLLLFDSLACVDAGCSCTPTSGSGHTSTRYIIGPSTLSAVNSKATTAATAATESPSEQARAGMLIYSTDY